MPPNRLIPQKVKSEFLDVRHSAGILDDFAVRKNVATKQGTVDATPTDSKDLVNKEYVDSVIAEFIPIGIIHPWVKSLSLTPPLSSKFLECNGQTVSDPESVYNGVTLPDLNGHSSGVKRYLKGSTTSGTTGGNASVTPTFTGTSGSTSTQVVQGGNNLAGGAAIQGIHTHTYTPAGTISTVNLDPPFYEVVWIIRIK